MRGFFPFASLKGRNDKPKNYKYNRMTEADQVDRNNLLSLRDDKQRANNSNGNGEIQGFFPFGFAQGQNDDFDGLESRSGLKVSAHLSVEFLVGFSGVRRHRDHHHRQRNRRRRGSRRHHRQRHRLRRGSYCCWLSLWCRLCIHFRRYNR